MLTNHLIDNPFYSFVIEPSISKFSERYYWNSFFKPVKPQAICPLLFSCYFFHLQASIVTVFPPYIFSLFLKIYPHYYTINLSHWNCSEKICQKLLRNVKKKISKIPWAIAASQELLYNFPSLFLWWEQVLIELDKFCTFYKLTTSFLCMNFLNPVT